MMRGEGENFFSREKKPNVGFVILFPLSRHSLGDGGSLPFKKSGATRVGNRAFIFFSRCFIFSARGGEEGELTRIRLCCIAPATVWNIAGNLEPRSSSHAGVSNLFFDVGGFSQLYFVFAAELAERFHAAF